MKNIRIPEELLEPLGRREDRVDIPRERPRGYLSECLARFLRRAAARAAMAVIGAIALLSLAAPLFIPRSATDMDVYYAKLPPRLFSLSEGVGVARGAVRRRLGDEALARLYAVGIGAGSEKYSPVLAVGEREGRVRSVKLDAYLEVGFIYKTVSEAEYLAMRAWEDESGLPLLFPLIASDGADANAWYRTDADGMPIDAQGERLEPSAHMPLVDDYLRGEDGSPVYSLPWGGGGEVARGLRVRMLYYSYYEYKSGYEPSYLLGTDSQGYDLALRTAGGVRVSLLLGVVVTAVNLVIGALVGAVEGYYGGAVDIALERVTDVLSGVPFIVVATLFQIYLADRVGALPSLLFAFVLTGWLGTANRVRGQFFRYKGAEYVLAARTMGISDGRIMWRHIFPNTLGTLITASALSIPGVIFTESMLSFLGIVNLGGEGVTSLGTLLSDAAQIWVDHPHLMLAPAAVVSLLMISFNIIGNSLRDAFDPSQRSA